MHATLSSWRDTMLCGAWDGSCLKQDPYLFAALFGDFRESGLLCECGITDTDHHFRYGDVQPGRAGQRRSAFIAIQRNRQGARQVRNKRPLILRWIQYLQSYVRISKL